MPSSKTIQTAFDSGKYSPRMNGRVDVEGYRNACKRIENFIVFPQGGAITRSGSKYIANTKLGVLEPLDVSTATYSNKSKDVTAFGANTRGLVFSSDGTKMYVYGRNTNIVYQYTLSTAWDLSTATYASKSKDVSAQDSAHIIAFSSDGTKMYMVGSGNITVYQYTLSTAWDLSTAFYSNKSKDVTAQDGTPLGIAFSSDGTKMYIVGNDNSTVYQYTLSTAWDVSTATFASKSKDASAQDGNLRGVAFSLDGTKMYIVGRTNQTVYQYTLSTAWDLSTATYASKSKDVSAQEGDPRGIAFSSDETSMYIVGTFTDTVYQYVMYTGKTRLIPFVISTVSAYIIEVGNEYMRFYKTGTQLTDAGSPVEIASPYLESDIFELDFAQTNNVMYFTHPDHAPRKLSRINDDEWVLHEVNFGTEPLIDDNFPINDVTGITQPSAGVAFEQDKTAIFSDTVNANFEFIDGDIGRVLFAGQRRANILWAKTGSVTQEIFGKIADSFLDSDTDFDVAELSVAGTPFGSLNPSAAGVPGDIITLTSDVNGNTASALTSETLWIESPSLPGVYYWNVNPTLLPDNVAWHGDFLKKRGNAPNIANVGEWAHDDADTLGFDTIYIRTPLDTDPTEQFNSQDHNAILRVDETGSLAELFRSDDEGKFIQINNGLVEIVTFQSATQVSCRVLQSLSAATSTTEWTLLSSYWDDSDYPGAVVFHENRLVLGGSPSFPNTFWGSEVSDFENFQPGVSDSNSYAFTLNARKSSLIRWLESRDVLIAGLEDSEWQIGLRNALITPSSIFVRRQTIHGCANIQSVVAEKSILFVERGGDKVRELNFDFESDSYLAPDLTLLAEDVGGVSGFKQMDVQNRPFPVIWGVNNSGELVGMTYIKNQNLSAWHVHKTGATAAGVSDASDEYESVAVIPNLTDETVDEVWVVVKRTIDGSTVRFVEQFEKPLDIDAAITDPRSLDAFIVDTSLSTTVSGLDHLEGDVVTAVIDGNPDKIETHTVVSGDIELTEAPTVNVVVGLPYTPLIQPMRPNAPSSTGTAQAQIQRINKIWLRLFNTLGLKCGSTESNISELNLAKAIPDDSDTPDQYYTFANDGFFTGDVEFEDYKGGNDRKGFIFIIQSLPLPATVTALISEVETG